MKEKYINWLPTGERIEKATCRFFKKFLNIGGKPKHSMKMICFFNTCMQTSSHIALEIILRKSELGKRSISFSVPSILNE